MGKRVERVSTLMLPRTSHREDASAGTRSRAGFSLMEVLVVLVIFGLATAVIMPSTSRMLDQTTAHAVFFEFQRQVSDFRREANRTGVSLRVIEPTPHDAEVSLPEDVRVVTLKSSWTYRLVPEIMIEEGGRCSAASVNLLKNEQVVMSLRSDDGSCRFLSQQVKNQVRD